MVYKVYSDTAYQFSDNPNYVTHSRVNGSYIICLPTKQIFLNEKYQRFNRIIKIQIWPELPVSRSPDRKRSPASCFQTKSINSSIESHSRRNSENCPPPENTIAKTGFRSKSFQIFLASQFIFRVLALRLQITLVILHNFHLVSPINATCGRKKQLDTHIGTHIGNIDQTFVIYSLDIFLPDVLVSEIGYLCQMNNHICSAENLHQIDFCYICLNKFVLALMGQK